MRAIDVPTTTVDMKTGKVIKEEMTSFARHLLREPPKRQVAAPQETFGAVLRRCALFWIGRGWAWGRS